MLDGVTLSLPSEVKYLGTVFDQQLNRKGNKGERGEEGFTRSLVLQDFCLLRAGG